jgi:hypothetical protein
VAHCRNLSILLCLVFAASLSTKAQQNQTKKRTTQITSTPLVFEPNQGQTSPSYRFLARRGDMQTLYLSNGMDIFVPQSKSAVSRVQLRWANANATASIAGEEALPGHSNYIRGSDESRWIHNVPQFERLRYKGIYPGTDLLFYGSGDQLENDFVLAPGADPSRISLRMDRPSHLTASGDLQIELGKSAVYLHRPVAYQELNGRRTEVPARFVRTRNGAVKFAVSNYDRTQPLVIDPVFGFSTYLAGSSIDQAAAVTTDHNGNIYVTGETNSLDFPVVGPLQTTCASCTDFNKETDAFITELDPTGHTILFSTYIGGSHADRGESIAIDPNGNIIVGGVSGSADFPHAGSTQSVSCQINGTCFFAVSLRPTGSALNYSGLVGGGEGFAKNSGYTGPYASGPDTMLALDGNGNAYLAGESSDPNFQITAGTLASSLPPARDDFTFVIKLSPAGATVFSTIIPGIATPDAGDPYANSFTPGGIFVDANGQVTLAGTSGIGLPATAGVIQPTVPASNLATESRVSGYVLQMNASASTLNYATYVPGTDYIGGLAVDHSGNVYVTGYTSETNLPVSLNAYQPTMKQGTSCTCKSGFVVKMDGQGKNVLAATYLGGTPIPQQIGTIFTAMALDSNSNVLLGGNTASTDFPLKNPFMTSLQFATFADGMVLAQMSPDLSSLTFGTFLSASTGQLAGSQFTGLAVDPQDKLIVVGTTFSASFPTTPNSFQSTLPANASTVNLHGFVTKLDLATAAPSVCFASSGFAFGNVPANTTSMQTFNVTNCGNAPLHIASIVSSNPAITAAQSCGAIAAGAVCPIQLTFTPPNSSLVSATITLNDDAVITPQVFGVSGQGVSPRLTVQAGSGSFGSLLVGTTGPTNPLFIANTGNANLSISTVSITGDFAISGNSCASAILTTHSPQNICVVVMTFSPTASGQRTGTLTITSNDPQFPQTTIALSGTGLGSYSIPTIAALGSPTAQITSSALTVQVSGTNFFPASVVRFNGSSVPTTFLNNGSISASVPAALLTNIGEVPITVFNPAPGGGESNVSILTLYRTMVIQPADLAYVPATGLLYVARPNTVQPIDPNTGNAGTAIGVCNDPRKLIASDDFKYLYVSCNGDRAIQRINIQTSASERTFSYPPNQTTVAEMHTVPGSSQQLVAAFDNVVALYNDSGFVNLVPVPVPNTNQSLSLSSFAFVGSNIYALPPNDAQTPFFTTLSVNAQGLQYTPYIGTNFGPPQIGAEVVTDGTLLYTNDGEVWNPTTQIKTGTFPVTTFNKTSYPNMFNTAIDNTLGQIYVIGDQNYGQSSSAMVLSAYGKQSLALTGSLAFPQLNDPFTGNLVRWGTDGFAFITSGINLSDEELYLVRSSIAAPQTASAAPVLNTLIPSSVVAGGSAFALVLNGTAFAPNATVYWNGSPRLTDTISATQITASITAADIAASGTAQITVVNPAPGGGTSAALALNITASGRASFSANSLSFGAQAVGTSATAQTVTITNTSTTNLSFGSISVSGDFSQTNSCATLAPNASCTVSVVFTPTTAGARTGTLTISDSDPSGQQTVALSGTATDIQIGATGSSGTSATVTAGQPASYALTISPMGGFSGPVTFGCSNLPANASCSISPSSTTLGASAVNVTVIISTSQQSLVVMRHYEKLPAVPASFLLLTTLVLFGSALPLIGLRFKMQRFALATILLAGAGMVACGGGSTTSGGGSTTPAPAVTPAGTYSVNFTVTGTGISRTVQLKLVVQ